MSYMIGFRRKGSEPISSEFHSSIIRRDDLRDRVYQSYEIEKENENPHRRYLGASDICHPCGRNVWYVFRHALRKKFPGKTLRLFNRGHREEPQVESDIRRIGLLITTTTPNGYQHSYTDPSGHSRVHLDGIIEEDDRLLVLEIKTMNKKSFDKLDSNGVRISHPNYYSQMQYQMLLAKQYIDVEGALFISVCKDDDRMHFEEIKIDEEEQSRLYEVASKVISSNPPDPIPWTHNPLPCWDCNFRKICRDNRFEQIEKNCRTCDHARPIDGSKWKCDAGMNYGTVCENYQLHREM